MHITITAARANLDVPYDTTTLRVITGLPPVELARVLKQRGIGYLEDLTAHINTLWLRDQNGGPQWQATIDNLIAAAESRNHFDGLFIEAPLQQVPALRYATRSTRGEKLQRLAPTAADRHSVGP